MATVVVVRSTAFNYKATPLSSHALIPLPSFLLHFLTLTHLLMASPTPTNTKDLESNSSSSSSPPTPPPQPTWITTNNTTYVQAEPWAFRAVVQKLTGVPEDSPHKLPVSGAPRSNRAPPPPPPPASLLKRQKLQERRRAPAKLEIELGASSARCSRPHHHLWSSKPEVAAGFSSPVSPMDPFFFNVPSPSPTTPSPSSLKREKEEEEEKRAIVEKGFFYLHPSARSGEEPPKLLALFPLHSSRDSSPR